MAEGSRLQLPGLGFEILLKNLLNDGYIEETDDTIPFVLAGVPSTRYYRATATGYQFIQRWISAQDVDG